MQQLTLVATRKFEWWDVPTPSLDGRIDALVRPIAVATCDLDREMIWGHTPHVKPIAWGHEFIGEIVATGDAVKHFQAGDVVAVSFQICCGECDACRRGHTASCRAVPPAAAFGFGAVRGNFGGAMSDLVRVPFADAMCVRIPPGVDVVAIASASDNIADAHRNVAEPLMARPGAPVLVVGGICDSIGLYTVEMALALGSEEVTYADNDQERLALAASAGAKVVDLSGGYPKSIAGEFPITVACAGTAEGVACTIRSTASNGVCTNTVIFWDEMMPLPMRDMYLSPITFRSGRINSRFHLDKVIALAAENRIHPERFTRHVVPWNQAAEALAHHATKTVFVR